MSYSLKGNTEAKSYHDWLGAGGEERGRRRRRIPVM